MTRLIAVLAALLPCAASPAAEFEAGFARVDVTPREPLRTSGYGGRDHPSDGADSPLHVRAMALRATGGETFVLVTIDTLGAPAVFTADVANRVAERHGVGRERFALCSTHTHAAPHLPSGITNVFTVPMTPAELAAGRAYERRARDHVVEAAGQAIADLKPARLWRGTGKAAFAANRRVLENGRWVRFGVNPDGPVDHTVDVLRVTTPDGQVRGVVFNYACHATTLGATYYRINGDWPAIAAQLIERDNPGATALCTIGCGADANPEPRGKAEQAEAHGRAMAAEVQRVMTGHLTSVTAAPAAAFGTAELSFELPTAEQLKARLADKQPQAARQAAAMLATLEAGGQLPATYPDPVQVWRFGDELAMVFLGGETVVDYALRLKREITGVKHVWVTAYANDVFAYVASERVRREGGYEVDLSMVLYDRPGPWVAGTEDVLVRRVHELVKRAAEPSKP